MAGSTTGKAAADGAVSGEQLSTLVDRLLDTLERLSEGQPLSAPQADKAQALIQLQYGMLSGLQGRPGFAPAVIPATRDSRGILLTNVSPQAHSLRFSTPTGDVRVEIGDLTKDADDLLVVGVIAPEIPVSGFASLDSKEFPIQLGGPLPAIDAAAVRRHS